MPTDRGAAVFSKEKAKPALAGWYYAASERLNAIAFCKKTPNSVGFEIRPMTFLLCKPQEYLIKWPRSPEFLLALLQQY